MHRAKSRPWLTKTTIFANKVVRRSRQSLRDGILDLAGLSALAVAAFHVNAVAGWTVIGVACFVLRLGMGDGKSS